MIINACMTTLYLSVLSLISLCNRDRYAAFSSDRERSLLIRYWQRMVSVPDTFCRPAQRQMHLGMVQCCGNYNCPQRLWLQAKLFRKLIKSCFTRCVRAAAGLPAAHLARPASECLPGSPPRKVCSGLPYRCTPLAAFLPAARGLPPRCVRPAYPPHAVRACPHAPATPPRAACLKSARCLMTPSRTPRAACQPSARCLPPHSTQRVGFMASATQIQVKAPSLSQQDIHSHFRILLLS
jgi:hypothetical protein